jgi:hypothetical protein
VVIIIDEEIKDEDVIMLKEILRSDNAFLLMRISSKSRSIQVDESYRLANPRITRIVSLLLEFNQKTQEEKSTTGMNLQKKMISVRPAPAAEYNRQPTISSFGRLFASCRGMDIHRDIAAHGSILAHGGMHRFFFSSLPKTAISRKRDASRLERIGHRKPSVA